MTAQEKMKTAETLLELAEQIASEAESVRQIDASGSYVHYWRGYATALDQCARLLRARSTQPEGFRR